jgi:hypothetical protein
MEKMFCFWVVWAIFSVFFIKFLFVAVKKDKLIISDQLKIIDSSQREGRLKYSFLYTPFYNFLQLHLDFNVLFPKD